MSRLLSSRYRTPILGALLFALVTLLAYGLLLPLTGFYWDDWPFAWLARFAGPAEFIPAFRGFRPFLGPIFFLTTSLIPPSPLLWQIFALLIRWLTGLAAWFALRSVWPAQVRQVLIASLLFLVFPGYSQHWVALTHLNQEWIPLLFYLLSFGFTARALRSHSPRLSTALALIFLLPGLFPTEYFIGLEPLRFLFIWTIVSERDQGFRLRLTRSLQRWWPYLLIWLVDAAWLAYYYRSGAYISYDVTAVRTVPSLAQAFAVFADALWKAGVYVWVQVLVLCARLLTAPTSLLTLALILITFLVALFLLLKLSPPSHPARTFALSAILIGLVGILLGRLPSFAAGLPLTLQSSYDRFMISMMLGAGLLVVGLVDLLDRLPRLKSVLFALLLALGVGQQFFNANIFRRDWSRQQEIYWQMAWRMPALKPATALVTQQMPLDYETDFSMTAALNWMYAPQPHPDSLPYALVYSEKRLGGVVLPALQPGTVMHFPFRTVEFTGNTSQIVAIYVPPNGCLRVLDPALGDSQTYSKFPASLTAPIALSDPSRILVDAPALRLPASPFGKEPAHSWCYFYERAELARQSRDWQVIVALASQASEAGYSPDDDFEWLPFIEAYARTGDLDSAQRLTRRLWDADAKLHRGLCVLWARLQQDSSPALQSAASALTGQYACGHY